MYSSLHIFTYIRLVRSILMSLVFAGSITQSHATLPKEKVQVSVQEPLKMCFITLHKVSVLKRKLNYQYWDSIEEPAPELFAKIMINRQQILYQMLTTESYEYSGQLTSTEFPCEWLAKRVHISIFDKDKSHSMEIVGEMTTRIRNMSDKVRRILSGGAVRELLLSAVVKVEDKKDSSLESTPQGTE